MLHQVPHHRFVCTNYCGMELLIPMPVQCVQVNPILIIRATTDALQMPTALCNSVDCRWPGYEFRCRVSPVLEEQECHRLI